MEKTTIIAAFCLVVTGFVYLAGRRQQDRHEPWMIAGNAAFALGIGVSAFSTILPGAAMVTVAIAGCVLIVVGSAVLVTRRIAEAKGNAAS